jgi:hypothetical protein
MSTLLVGILTTTVLSPVGVAVSTTNFPVKSSIGIPCEFTAKSLFGYGATSKEGVWSQTSRKTIPGSGGGYDVVITTIRTFECAQRPSGR